MCAATVDGAAELGEIVLVAIAFGAYRDVPVKALAGRVVVDATKNAQRATAELLAENLGRGSQG